MEKKKYYLKTPYNIYKPKDNDVVAYRSPYSNVYYPSIAVNETSFPSLLVRNIEEKGEILFN